MEGTIKNKPLITLEIVFKRGEISGCATERARNVDGIIPTPQGFMLSERVIQSLSTFWLIMTIGSCQEMIPIKILLAARLEKDTNKADCIISIR